MYHVSAPEAFLGADDVSFEPEPLNQPESRRLFRQNRVGASFDYIAASANSFECATDSGATLQQNRFERHFMRCGKFAKTIRRGKSGNASAQNHDPWNLGELGAHYCVVVLKQLPTSP